MTGQMSLWDFVKTQSLDEISEEDMVRQVSEATGLPFKWRDDFWKWECKVKGYRFSTHYSNYDESVNEGRRFISAGCDSSKEGRSTPADSIEEAIEFFRRCIAYYLTEDKS